MYSRAYKLSVMSVRRVECLGKSRIFESLAYQKIDECVLSDLYSFVKIIITISIQNIVRIIYKNSYQSYSFESFKNSGNNRLIDSYLSDLKPLSEGAKAH